jgi:hypothetical protein
MEQGTYTNPNLLALEGTTGEVRFKPTGSSSYVDFGPIEMSKITLNPQTEDTYFAINGASVMGAKQNRRISPVIAFDGKLFTDEIEQYLNFGAAAADTVQASGSGSTATVTAALGRSFDIGARNVTLTTVQVGGVTKVRDSDYFFDELSGFIRFPFIAAGIAAGASVVVTFDKPAITRKTYTGGSVLNFYGAMLYTEKDDKSSIVRAEWNFPSITLNPKEPGDSGTAESIKNKKWSMEGAISGQWTKLKRAA